MYTTVLWIVGILGKKKYYLLNDVNIFISKILIKFLTFKCYSYNLCVLYSVLLRNDVYGFLRGFRCYLIVKGLGFKIMSAHNEILFKIGFSHEIVYKVPYNLKMETFSRKQKALKIFGVDYQFLKEVSM